MSIRVKKPRLLLADKCYDGDNVRDALLCSGIKPVIAPKENRKNLQPATASPTRVETASSGCLNSLKQLRRIATRYDKARNLSRHS